MGNTRTRGRRLRVSLAAAVSGAGLIATMASAASADPAPDQGPTAGGTVVTDTLPEVELTAVAGGLFTGYALDQDGRAYAWGQNIYAQLGDGSSDPLRRVPGPVSMENVPAGVTFTKIAAESHSSVAYALGTDGRVYEWGGYSRDYNDDPALMVSEPVPVQTPMGAVPAGVTFTDVAAGDRFAVALGSDNKVYTWGLNAKGQLGDGTTVSRLRPAPIASPAGVEFIDVAAGDLHAYAVGDDGRVYAWGDNQRGQLGNGTTTDSRIPVLVNTPAPVPISQIASGPLTGFALDSNGAILAWGNKGVCCLLGDGTVAGSPTQYRSWPEPVLTDDMPSGVRFTEVFSGGRVGLAKGSDGNLYVWGDNDEDQVGVEGQYSGKTKPVQVSMTNVPDGVTFTAASGGTGTNYAVGSDGRAYSWGGYGWGQLGNGASTTQKIPTAIGDNLTATSVLFGSNAGTDVGVMAGRAWNATTPGGCGPVDVDVEYSVYGVGYSASFPGGFTYGSAPAVTVQPSSGEIPAGGGAFTATAAASGDSAPAVQWQRQGADGTWSDIDGATDPTLSVQVAETTSFRAVFTNCWGASHAATSEVAVATVLTAGGGTDPGTGTATPTVAPTDPAASTAAPAASGVLAHTGGRIALAALAALVLAAAGTGLVIARRRANAA